MRLVWKPWQSSRRHMHVSPRRAYVSTRPMAWGIDATALQVMRAILTYHKGVKVRMHVQLSNFFLFVPMHHTYMHCVDIIWCGLIITFFMILILIPLSRLVNVQTSTNVIIHPFILVKVLNVITPMETTPVLANQELIVTIRRTYHALGAGAARWS